MKLFISVLVLMFYPIIVTLNSVEVHMVLVNVLKYYKAKTIIFFISPKLIANRDLDETALLFPIPKMIFTHLAPAELHLLLYRDFLSVVLSEHFDEADSIRTTVDSQLRNVHHSKIIIIILTPTAIKRAALRTVFMWCWNKGMVNAVIIYREKGAFQIFSYTPFPSVILLNKTASPGTVFNREIMKNLKGHPIKSILSKDVPRVFKYEYQQKSMVGGFAGKLFFAFIDHHNARFKDVFRNTTNLDMDDAYTYLRDGVLDILVQPYTSTTEHVQLSYPLSFQDLCVLAPANREIPPYMYIISPYETPVWQTIVAFVILSSAIIGCTHYILTGKRTFGKLLGIAILTTINQTSEIKSLKSKRWHLIYCQQLILGFILTNLYLALLTSFLAVTIYSSDIKTIDDMFESNIHILTVEQKIKKIFSINRYQAKYRKVFIGTSVEDFEAHFNAFNTSFAYPVSTDKADFLLEQDKRFPRPNFKLTPICFGSILMGFPLPRDSPYLGILNRFILLSFQSGLMQKWKIDAFHETVRAGLTKKHIQERNKPNRLNLNHLYLVWWLLAFGWLTSVVVFAMEMFIDVLAVLFSRTKRKCTFPMKELSL